MQDPSDHQTTTPMKQTSHATHLGFDFLESVKILWMETLIPPDKRFQIKATNAYTIVSKGLIQYL